MIYKSKFNGIEKVHVHMLLDKQVHEKLSEIAQAEGIKRNGLITNILSGFVRQNEKKESGE